jgi:phenylalanyl-tRNA synthetase alpha chain
MEKEKLLLSLSAIERKVLPYAEGSSEEIAKKAGTDVTTVLRALDFLTRKGLVEVKTEEKKLIDLGINGIYYQKKGLPERRLLDELAKKKSIPLSEIGNTTGLNDNEAKISIGVLKKKALVEIKEGRVVLSATEKEVEKKSFEEELLAILPLEEKDLKPEQKFALENLKARKDIIEIREKKIVISQLTSEGKKIKLEDLKDELIEKLTPKMIRAGNWKGKKFRAYDITSPVPKIYGGKRHFVNQATDYAKKIWLDMGFKEMTGDLALTSFWDFDALFTPQDHPARDIQDTFFIKGVKGKLPEKKIVDGVKKAHEGGTDGSLGWNYDWNEENARAVCLRPHTTTLSVKNLKKIGENKEFPTKYFALGKCFRNETVDWSHGFEFNQTEGIVIDETASFRQLLGYLNQFFKRMGHTKLRFRPHYFPYTEPSVEVDSWNEDRKCWVEIGGAGMFRPEVTIPFFGKHIPVLAWGPGFDRIIMKYFDVKDLRDFYKNNLTKSREMRFWGE